MAGLYEGPQAPPGPVPTPVPSPTPEGPRIALATAEPAAAPPAAAPPAAPTFVPFDKSKQTGAEYFASLIPKAAEAAGLPPGYTVVPTSGYRPGAIAADTGLPSQHATAGALDFAVRDPQGKTVQGAGLGNPDPTGHYRAVAVALRQMVDPDMQPWMAWGGNFGRIDPGHVDFGGDRGSRGKLATIAARR